MPDIKHSVLIVIIAAAVTAVLRVLPFSIFSSKKKTPEFIKYAGTVLPYAAMGMLVIFCLRNISFASSPFGLPEIICCLVTAGVHIWKRNTLLSIGLGTVLYIIFVNFIFI